jgi:hypothetical protein
MSLGNVTMQVCIVIFPKEYVHKMLLNVDLDRVLPILNVGM